MTSHETVKDLAKGSLSFLCQQFLGYYDWDICHDDMEKFMARPAQRKLILVPREHLKTSVITIGYSIQQILKNPNIRILLANQVWNKAREMLGAIKEYLTSKSDLPALFGSFASDRWTIDDIVVRGRTKALKEPTIATTGVEAETTGGHYDLIVLDDLQGLQNFQTFEQREKVKRFYRSMINLIEPEGTILVVGTRWHLDDLYGHIIGKEAEYYDVMVRRIVENGQVIFPKKFSKVFDPTKKTWIYSVKQSTEYVEYLKKSLPSEEFSSQYMNNPIDAESQIFKPAYFKTFDRRPDHLFVSMTVDPALSEKRSADSTAINVAGMNDRGDIYVLDTLKGHWTVNETIENIFTMYSKWHPNSVGIETVAYQKALKEWNEYQMIWKRDHFPITEIKHESNESKEFRIKALEPFYRNGKIYHAPWMRSLEDELLSFPKGAHDDEIDALSMQLQLLYPGDAKIQDTAPEGSWEDSFQQARKHNMRYSDFFHERLK